MRTKKITFEAPLVVKHLVKPGMWIELPVDLPSDQAEERVNSFRDKQDLTALTKWKKMK